MLVELLTAPGWGKCEAAKALAVQVIEAARAERPDLELRIVDVTEAPETAVRYGVRATPAIVIDGELVATGMPRAEALRARLFRA